MVQKMKKSKGFTLIEMLVVIAIIAVLVAIIIPTVSSATVKAGAATNAANLRSVYAELQTDILSIGKATDETGYVHWEDGVPELSGAPASAASGSYIDKGVPMNIFGEGTDAAPYYVAYEEKGEGVSDSDMTITYFATIAETGAEPEDE